MGPAPAHLLLSFLGGGGGEGEVSRLMRRGALPRGPASLQQSPESAPDPPSARPAPGGRPGLAGARRGSRTGGGTRLPQVQARPNFSWAARNRRGRRRPGSSRRGGRPKPFPTCTSPRHRRPHPHPGRGRGGRARQPRSRALTAGFPKGWRPTPAAGREGWGRGRALREVEELNVPPAPRVHLGTGSSRRGELPKLPPWGGAPASGAPPPAVRPRNGAGPGSRGSGRSGAGREPSPAPPLASGRPHGPQPP